MRRGPRQPVWNLLQAAVGIQAKIWDVASGLLLVREAGGQMTDPHGRPLTPFGLTAGADRNIPFLAATANSYDDFLRRIDGLRGKTSHTQ